MLETLRRLAQWLLDKIVFPLTTTVPGVPYLFRRQIINGYLTLAGSVQLDYTDTFVITTMLDVTIKPWHRLLDLKRLIAPMVTVDPPPATA
jgi:hypothetical protein